MLNRAVHKVLWPALFVVTLLAVLFYSVFPTNIWLDQRSQLTDTRSDIDELEAANAELVAQIDLLGTDAEIERIARADYGLVKPDEEAYAVLPAASSPVTLPARWPFTVLIDDITR